MSARKTVKKVPVPPHRLGATRRARLDQLRAIKMFDDPPSLLGEIARLALWANEATTDEEMRTRAVYALGLHGRRTVDANVDKLREALEDLYRFIDAVYPTPDPETGDSPEPPGAGTGTRLAYDDLLAEGVPQWLYRRVKGKLHGDERTQQQFLQRTAKTDKGTLAMLHWVLSIWRADRPPLPNSRGRVR